MDRDTLITINIILQKVEKIEKDITELKTFKNRVLGGLAVFCFILNLVFKQVMN